MDTYQYINGKYIYSQTARTDLRFRHRLYPTPADGFFIIHQKKARKNMQLKKEQIYGKEGRYARKTVAGSVRKRSPRS